MKPSRSALILAGTLAGGLLLVAVLAFAPLHSCPTCRGSGSMGRFETFEPDSATRYVEDVQCRTCWGRRSVTPLRRWTLPAPPTR